MKNEISTENSQHVCKNCKYEFEGDFCPSCGQSKKGFNRPFHFVVYDFAGTLFSFDTRLLRSLRDLLIYPGRITTNYVEGQQVRYMKPFQMFVFVSFLFFLLLSQYTSKTLKESYDPNNNPGVEVMDSTVNFTMNAFRNALDSAKDESDTLEAKFIDNIKYLVDQKANSTEDAEEASVIRRLSRLLDNPNYFFVNVFKYLSWGFFLLMPVYGLLLMLFFRNSKHYYVAHLTMAIHQHVIFFILLLIGLLTLFIFSHVPVWLIIVLSLVLMVYQLLSLFRFYGKSVLRTFFYLFSLNFIYFFCFALAIGEVVTLSFFNI